MKRGDGEEEERGKESVRGKRGETGEEEMGKGKSDERTRWGRGR